MRAFPSGGNAMTVGAKGFFGPAFNPFNVQVFGPGSFTWTKPTPPAGKRIVSIVITAVGAGGGGIGGGIGQNSGSGIVVASNHGGGAGGGWCQYTPTVASVPATVAVVVATGGAGGIGASHVGNLGNPPQTILGTNGGDGSGNTTVAGTVIVCNPGSGTAGGNVMPGGGATCPNTWGGSHILEQGGNGGGTNINMGGPAFPTDLTRQKFTPSAFAGVSPVHAPGGGGSNNLWAASTPYPFVSTWGGAPGGAIGPAPVADVMQTALGPALVSHTLANSPAGGALQGGPGGPSIWLNPQSNPAGNAYTQQAGNGGDGGTGAGGGAGGQAGALGFINPGTLIAGNGGRGGDGQVLFVVTFG